MTSCNCRNGTGPACSGCADNCQCEHEGERRKRDKFAMLEARREVYVDRGRRALRIVVALLPVAAAATSRDLPDKPCGFLPLGFFFPQRHASYIQLWELADYAAAMRWLAGHPDRPDPAPEHDQVVGTLFGPDTLRNERPAAVTVGR